MNFKEMGAKLGLDEEEFRELIDLFLESGSVDLQKIVDGLAAGNADQVMRAAHTIKGAAGNLGLIDISAAAKVIEMRATKIQLNDVSGALSSLQNLMKDLRASVA